MKTRFKAARKDKNLSLDEASNLLGVTKSALYHWEGGTREPCLSVLVKMSEIYGVTIDYLLYNDNPRQDPVYIPFSELSQYKEILLEPISIDPVLKEKLCGRYRIIGDFAENRSGNRFSLDTYNILWVAKKLED